MGFTRNVGSRTHLTSIKLNSSLIEAQSFELVESGLTASFGLGGATPASATSLGAGNHARVVCDTALLDGNLEVPFLYGFVPQLGQQFQIITVNTPNGPGSGLSGRFANVREGGTVHTLPIDTSSAPRAFYRLTHE